MAIFRYDGAWPRLIKAEAAGLPSMAVRPRPAAAGHRSASRRDFGTPRLSVAGEALSLPAI